MKGASFKIFFIDACRGELHSEIKRGDLRYVYNKGMGSSKKFLPQEQSKSILYSNSNGYRSYEAPYDPILDDITMETTGLYCGIFLNAVYLVYRDNVINPMSYAFLCDKIKRKAKETRLAAGDKGPLKYKKVAQMVSDGGNLEISVKLRMVFKYNGKY